MSATALTNVTLQKDIPPIVGIYGLPGCGKSTLLDKLKKRFEGEPFSFIEGSQALAGALKGRLERLRDLTKDQQDKHREQAIHDIRIQCLATKRFGVVAGHYMFWPEAMEAGNVVWTESDSLVYTAIVYLEVDPQIIQKRCRDDKTKNRYQYGVDHIRKWQKVEIEELRDLCYSKGIHFTIVKPDPQLVSHVAHLLYGTVNSVESKNLIRAEERLDEIVDYYGPHCKTLLVFDADKTLAPSDTGHMFWKQLPLDVVQDITKAPGATDVLGQVFHENAFGYTYAAFRQIAFVYQQLGDRFETTCSAIVDQVSLYPQMEALLNWAAGCVDVRAVVLTCGLSNIWSRIFYRHGLESYVGIIGGGRIGENFIVTQIVKQQLVTRLRNHHCKHVVTFGDSSLDVPMMVAAHEAVVAVGADRTRSRAVDQALANALLDQDFKPRQAIMVEAATPRLDTNRLPIVDINGESYQEHLKTAHLWSNNLNVVHATNTTATRLLASNMRDAAYQGPVLREAHHKAGAYLALVHVTEIIGLEAYDIQHVQGTNTQGHRLQDEASTLIVALMRGGEPMAFGVNEVFPKARFAHAKEPIDLDKSKRLVEDAKAIILVDSVISTGKPINDFLTYLVGIRVECRVIVVTGVIQVNSIDNINQHWRKIKGQKLDIVALRKSENKYAGQGQTDTGHRLFNTTVLP